MCFYLFGFDLGAVFFTFFTGISIFALVRITRTLQLFVAQTVSSTANHECGEGSHSKRGGHIFCIFL